jgi:AcrR family transcriptional regulator
MAGVTSIAVEAGDGRIARGERTRQALAEAMISLLEEGDAQPTARRIAERAGVSLRIVFHHFEDLESLLRAAVDIQRTRHWRRLGEVDSTLPLKQRITAVVRQRAEVFEAVAPVRRAAQVVEPTSPTVAAQLGRLRKALRQQLDAAFAPELAALSTATARMTLDAVDVSLSWESWEQLRTMGRTAAAGRRTFEALAGAVLAGPTSPGGRP